MVCNYSVGGAYHLRMVISDRKSVYRASVEWRNYRHLDAENCTDGWFTTKWVVFFLYKRGLWKFLCYGKRGRAVHESPLPRGFDSCLYADGGRVFAYSSLTPSNDASAIGHFRVGSAYLASRISPAIVLAFLHGLRLRSVWVYLVSLRKRWK